MKRKQPLYAVNACLAGGVLFYALRLSAGDRGTIDWVVIGLVSAAILHNLVQLSRRLHRTGGGRAVWHVQRTVLFWIVGLLNTVLLRPEDTGGWRPVVGWAVLLVAVLDTAALVLRERRAAPGL